MNNAEKLLGSIKTQHMVPKPRWHFVLSNVFFWTLGALSALLGGLSFSLVVYALQTADFSILEHLDHSRGEFFLGIIPLLWIFSLVLFFLFAVFGLQHTKKGYKIPPLLLFGGNILLSGAIGVILFFTGFSENFDNAFAAKVPFYESIEERRTEMWSHPENGLLSGEIVSKNNTSLLVKDFSGKTWEIETQNALIRQRVTLEPGEKIKIIGEISRENVFTVKEVRPWEGQRKRGIPEGE